VRDREGNWTYQFAVVVDDDAQGVTLVVRGDDLLASTGRQIQLGRAEPPVFLHHALVMKSETQKLSKADGDTSVRDLRARGLRADEIIAEAAVRAGLLAAGRRPGAAEVPGLPALVALGARAAAAISGGCGRGADRAGPEPV
jgi:glutamyl-tRNA synthetase/glutamyl-Q tRNA(Asp) synthetase